MNGLQVSVMCLLLVATFDPVTAQFPLKPIRCPTCPEGFFMKKNCSEIRTSDAVEHEGVQCEQCTDCSAADQVTLVECSSFADSQCGSKGSPADTPADTPDTPDTPTWTPALTPTGASVSAPEAWIILSVITLSLFLVLLLALFFVLLSCRKKLKALDPL